MSLDVSHPLGVWLEPDDFNSVRCGDWILQWEDAYGPDGDPRWIRGRARVLHAGRLDRVIPEVERPQAGAIGGNGTAIIVDVLADRADRPNQRSAVMISFPGGPTIIHTFSADFDRLKQLSHDTVRIRFIGTPREDAVDWVEFSLVTGGRLRERR